MQKKSKTFRDLLVWQKAHSFVLDVYASTKKFPREELFGLTSQFRRAAVSIAANIVEGFKKRTKQDKNRFYNIAQGSIEECKYYLILANDLGYLNDDAMSYKLEEVSKLLEGNSKGLLNSDY